MAYTNPSIEDLINKYHNKTSQINPNSSSANLFKLTNNNNNNNQYYYNNNNHQLHTPPLSSNPSFTSFQNLNYPLSPLSKPTSPEPRLSSSATSYLSSSSLFYWLPPIDLKITSFCIFWYLCSIVSSNSTKLILNDFKYPITLTQFQFSISSILCLTFLIVLKFNTNLIHNLPKGFIPNNLHVRQFLTPTSLIINTTLPMGIFQFIGHITSHKATSLIPVSIVHTVKSLSPIITVLIYKVLFKKNYKTITYITLLPLCCGIMLTCYKKSNTTDDSNFTHVTGLVFAFLSMIIFVSQNIFAKKRLTIETNTIPMDNRLNKDKVDKLTILFYCSVIGFTLTSPVYFMSEFINYKNLGVSLFQVNSKILTLVLLNGFSHFVQSLLAFQVLGMVSPINYSIASILKRIFIILISFIWESKHFSNSQSFGLIITLFGLYCYDRWGSTN
ncbi:SLY41 Uncharacterized transporter SLY41 [Candida maltosa Xu316]